MSLIIDDQDQSIQYSSGWERAGSDREFNHTTTASSTQGATARLAFLGTRISVFGTISIRPEVAESQYSIDDGDPVTFQGATTAQGPDTYHQLFFRSPELSDGPHILTVTNIGTENVLWLDYFLVELPEADRGRLATATITVTSARPRETVVATSLSVITVSIPEGTSEAAKLAAQGSSSANAGVIAGGVIGAICFVLLAFLAICMINRRLRRPTNAYAGPPLGTVILPPESFSRQGNASPFGGFGPAPSMHMSQASLSGSSGFRSPHR
ncbi:hypothetical protein FA15DRAFT_293134 [Coprinopsis marcescibilis]|uniref:Uncharacterized protein n=1 Tax=Coprinopsis marcescibilis TaxID=230819 RepID=A0A5C3L0H2_COPMA|nr:hypothetical protein FA15DRAFT_293134 [Coprinopsis marcescibilis]